MIVTVLIVAGALSAPCVVAVVHDAVWRRRRLAALREWAHEHCISLAGLTRRELREVARRYAELVDLGHDLAEFGRLTAMQQQITGTLRAFGRTSEGRRVAAELRADLARGRRERAS